MKIRPRTTGQPAAKPTPKKKEDTSISQGLITAAAEAPEYTVDALPIITKDNIVIYYDGTAFCGSGILSINHSGITLYQNGLGEMKFNKLYPDPMAYSLLGSNAEPIKATVQDIINLVVK